MLDSDISLIPVRPDSGEDTVFICALMNDESVMRALNEVPVSIETWNAALKKWHNDIDEEDYIIYCEGERAGWLSINSLFSPSQRTYVKMLAVMPAYQGKGIGSEVMRSIIYRLKRRGYLSVDLHTNKDNIAAVKCYIKCGFKIIGTVIHKMSDGTLKERYTMRRRL